MQLGFSLLLLLEALAVVSAGQPKPNFHKRQPGEQPTPTTKNYAKLRQVRAGDLREWAKRDNACSYTTAGVCAAKNAAPPWATCSSCPNTNGNGDVCVNINGNNKYCGKWCTNCAAMGKTCNNGMCS